MIVKVEVTEQDIKLGWDWSYIRMQHRYGKNLHRYENKRCEHCPVAVAMARAFGQKIICETYRLHIGGKAYRTPEVVSDFMYEFDLGREAKPFSFELDLADENPQFDS